MDDGEPDSADTPVRRRRRKRDFVTALLLLFAFVVLVSWWQRIAIADDFLRRELDRRDVRATYRIEQVGLRTQRIRNLVLGDPARPDLVADLVEIDLSFGPTPQVTALRVEGARLYGRWADGRLQLGALDRFRDPASTEPFALPFIRARLRDVRARIETPAGPVAATLDGAGWLDDGFRGRLAMVGRNLTAGGCGLAAVSYYGRVTIDEQRPALDGPLRFGRLACPGQRFASSGGVIDLDARLSERLDRGSGTATLRLGPLLWQDRRAAGADGRLTIQGGSTAGGVDARYVLAVGLNAVAAVEGRARRVALDGEGRLAVGDAAALTFAGRAAATGTQLPSSTLAPLVGAARGAAGTPVAPLAEGAVAAAAQIARSFDLSASVDLAWQGRKMADGVGTIRIADAGLTSASGARIRLQDAVRISNQGAGWTATPAGTVSFAGGGLPNGVLRLAAGRGGGFDGLLRMDDYAAGGAALALPELRFVARADGGVAVSGSARFSGPLAGGRIVDARLPIEGRVGPGGSLALYDRCVDLAFARLQISSLALGPHRVRACPDPGRPIVDSRGLVAARVAALDLVGRIGSAPFQLSSGPVRVTGGEGVAITAERVATRIGAGDAPTRIAMDRLDGKLSGGVLDGRFAGGGGQVGSVPLRFGDAAGSWRFADGALALEGGLAVRDAETDARFQPMRMPRVTLRLAGNRITAEGPLVEPESGAEIADVTLRHDLGSGTGNAAFVVDGIEFGERLQPDQLTRLALGVVANVKGKVTGSGRIDWDGGGVRSTGSFSTDSLDLAAAFGPVTGARGTIRFSDLLGLETGAEQELYLAEANPGVAVKDGLVRYRILGGQRVAIEGGRWPFAGGALVLAPTTLDFGEERERRLDFRVEGVDAAKLIELFNLGNLTASGVFDGSLPIVFDDEGARIDGGALTSRPGGGTIAYVGELTYEDLGFYGNYAFQALRSIRYRRLDISMNGNLGGEIITEVGFAGLQQGEGAKRNLITRQLEGLPIQFNVRISAPFMQLVNSIRGYYDPSLLIRQNLPALMEAQGRAGQSRSTPPDGSAIQPPASEKVP